MLPRRKQVPMRIIFARSDRGTAQSARSRLKDVIMVDRTAVASRGGRDRRAEAEAGGGRGARPRDGQAQYDRGAQGQRVQAVHVVEVGQDQERSNTRRCMAALLRDLNNPSIECVSRSYMAPHAVPNTKGRRDLSVRPKTS